MYIVVHKGSACNDLSKHMEFFSKKNSLYSIFKIYLYEFVIVSIIVDLSVWDLTSLKNLCNVMCGIIASFF